MSELNNENQNNNMNQINNNRFRKIIIIAGIVLVVIIGALIILLITSKKENNQSNNNGNNSTINDNKASSGNNSTDFFKSNVTIDVKKSNNNDLVFLIKNNNVSYYNVDIIVNADLYDASGKIISSEKFSFYGVGSGEELVKSINLRNKENYDHYQFNYEVKNSYPYVSTVNDIEILSNVVDIDGVHIKLKNKGNKKIEYTKVGVVFYKNGEIEGADTSTKAIFDIDSDASVDVNIDFPHYVNGKVLNTDDYKLYIQSYTH